MREFFHGWRRKEGCVTLVMACALMAEWDRSREIGDSLYLSFGGTANWILVSVDSSLLWVKREFPGSQETSMPFAHFESHDFLPPSRFYHVFNIDDVQWQWYLMGFGFGDLQETGWSHGYKHTLLMVPYWSIVLPVTLQSARLLLSKPKPKAKPVAPEPASNQG
jgi:hypothetical protein